MPLISKFAGSALRASLLLCLAGCSSGNYGLTHALWTRFDNRKFCMPAPDPRLELRDATSKKEILVIYDELDEKKDAIERRAYYSEENRSRIQGHRQPLFVSQTNALMLAPVPVVTTQADTKAARELPIYATRAGNRQQFVVYQSGVPQCTNDLPFYPRTSDTATKVILTPFAVAGDATIVGFFVGCAVLSVYHPEPLYDRYNYR